MSPRIGSPSMKVKVRLASISETKVGRIADFLIQVGQTLKAPLCGNEGTGEATINQALDE